MGKYYFLSVPWDLALHEHDVIEYYFGFETILTQNLPLSWLSGFAK